MCTLFEEGNVNVDSRNNADEPKLRLTRFSPIKIESDVIDRVYGRKVNKAQQKKKLFRVIDTFPMLVKNCVICFHKDHRRF